MRWLLIALLISLAAMLIAAAGVVLHIRGQRRRSRSGLSGADAAPGSAEETDVETEL